MNWALFYKLKISFLVLQRNPADEHALEIMDKIKKHQETRSKTKKPQKVIFFVRNVFFV